MKFVPSVILAVVIAATGILANGDHHDHHDDHNPLGLETCGCVAERLDFRIDCDNLAVVQEAFDFLEENDCDQGDACTTNADCERNFFITESHHDYCLHSDLTPEINSGVHKYENKCVNCFVRRRFNPDIEMCPSRDCTNITIVEDAIDYLEDNCKDNCTSSTCEEAYQTLRYFHDVCAVQVENIPSEVQKELHHFENVCEDQECRTATEEFDPNECKSSAASSVAALALTFATVVMSLLF
eukprot:gene3063-5840_t